MKDLCRNATTIAIALQMVRFQSVFQNRPDVIAGHKMTHIYDSLCYFYHDTFKGPTINLTRTWKMRASETAAVGCHLF